MNKKQSVSPLAFQSNPSLPVMNEFIRLIDIKKLASFPLTLVFAANEKEKEALAKRLGLVVLKSLDVKCQIHGSSGCYPLQVSAFIKAEIIQSCVVTLRELVCKIEEPVSLAIYPADTDLSTIPDTFEEKDPEAVLLNHDGTLDVGEIFVQYLSLALDPYPKFERKD